MRDETADAAAVGRLRPSHRRPRPRWNRRSSKEAVLSAARTGAGPFLSFCGVSKTYGGTRAVRDVSLDVHRSQVHAFVGENGAGKSTCLGMAAGRVTPTRGAIFVEGRELRTGHPRDSHAMGIYAIYQELTIVPALSTQANVFLGQCISRAGAVCERVMRDRYVELCGELGVTAHPDVQARTLSIADQQMLEIMRALLADARCVLFDEPTASLAEAERAVLFTVIDRLREQGMAIAFVSHNLDEVLEHSDVVTVFRDGAVTASRAASNWSKQELVMAMLGEGGSNERLQRAMVGRRLDANRRTTAQPVLSVESLSSPGRLHSISFDLNPGEILGVAGLVGSGRTSLLRALSGLDREATGCLRIGGRRCRVPTTVIAARALGIALLPEDRKGQGLVLKMESADNVVLGEYGSSHRYSWVRDGRVQQAAAAAAAPVGFDAGRLRERAASLSGGNQQKLMLSRWRHTDHPILLADEPTRGVDVGAKGQILASLEEIVANGRSMLVVSSEIEEVIALSDRVLIIANGRLVRTLDSSMEDITVEVILREIFTVKEENDVGD